MASSNRSTAVVAGPAEPVDLDWPLGQPPTADDIRRAQRAVSVHRPQNWPSGLYCVNCRAPAEVCSLRCWGWRVLQAAGWPQRAITTMVAEFERTVRPPWKRSLSRAVGSIKSERGDGEDEDRVCG
jgi:hypothetical protein